MRKWIFLSLSLMLVGCSSMPLTMYSNDGKIREAESQFDGVKETHVEVAFLKNWKIKLGAYKKSNSEDIVMIAEVVGAHSIQSLAFRIGEEKFEFKPFDLRTEIRAGSLSSTNPQDYLNHSSRKFIVSKAFLEKLTSAKSPVIVRVNLISEFIEDTLDKPEKTHGFTFAKESLTAFYEKLYASPGKGI